MPDRPFDPDAAAKPGSGLFGLASSMPHAGVRVVPVPFDATASYRRGAALGPEAILRASHQVDLFDLWTGKPYEEGICLLPEDPRIAELNRTAAELVDEVRRIQATSENPFDHHDPLRQVNAIGSEINAIAHGQVAEAIDAGRLAVVVGGDHSVAFGSIHAAAETCPGMGILHVDAHADLRPEYEGFEWSHASVFHNVLNRVDEVASILQVGLRDVSEEEVRAIEKSDGRIEAVFDRDWVRAKLERASLREYVRERLSVLPDEVYVSFDVDGLDPGLCPHTGTPVPGGLSWHEAMLWLDELVASRRRIVGADLVEVSPGETAEDEDSYDAIVGARLLYRLIGFALASAG